jgi:peptide/nickel transport system permease protein
MKNKNKKGDPSVRKPNSQIKEVWRRLKKNRPAVGGLVMFVLIVLIAVFADLIVDARLTTAIDIPSKLQSPNAQHLFGTDHLGRDVLARIVHGARPSLSIGVAATVICTVFGVLLGGIVGYYGGRADTLIMRIADVVTCIPSMLLLLVIITVMGTSLINMLIALCISNVPSNIRMVRSVVINVSDSEYIHSARAYGTPDLLIIIKHVIPNALGPIIISATGMISGMILAAAALSFLGFGIQPPNPEWGVMISESRQYMRTNPYLMFIPGIFIVLSALSINLVGDGLRDALDPRLKD